MSALLWFVLGLGVMALELFLPGFVLVFFGVGAWVTALLVWPGLIPSFNAQLLVFLGASLASLFALRRWLQRTLQGRVSDKELSESKLDDFVGHRAKVTRAISPDTGDGRVEFRGTEWKAASKSPIAVDATVRIVWKKNLTLGVEPVARNEE